MHPSRYRIVRYSGRDVPGPRIARLACVAAGALVLAGIAAARGHPNASAPSHASAAHGGGGAPHMPGGAGGGPHIPGSMGGGAHIPGSMGGGAHIPGGMAGGAHTPGGAHVPGGAGGTAHVPSSMQSAHIPGQTHVPGGAHGQPAHEAGDRTASGRASEAHESRGTSAAMHQNGGERAGRQGARPEDRPAPRDARAGPREGHELTGHAAVEHAAFVHNRSFAAARHDVRLGGDGKLNTRGLQAGLAVHRPPNPALRPDTHRDIARDRDFVAHHKNDFHTRKVRDFDAHELAAWKGGVWRNEWHYGRRGWWWDVDGVYYDYPDPVWPYPDEVAELTVYDTPVIDGPDLSAYEIVPAAGDVPVAEAVGAAPVVAIDAASSPTEVAEASPAGIPPLPAAPVGWYHCDGPLGYYPGITICTPGWVLVQTPPLPGER